MNAEGMVGQTDIKWQFHGGLFSSYAKKLDPERVLRKVYDKGTFIPSASYNKQVRKEVLRQGNALICDITQAMEILADTFSETGTCNYILTEDKILASDSALAFQVIRSIWKILLEDQYVVL